MISILLSCYNSNMDFLDEQIKSVLAQTEKDFELLVYNDGTSDLEEFLKKYRDPRIKYFDIGHLGYSKAYNYLLKQATGEYVCFCDHDDIWVPDKLEIEKKYLDEHPEVDCVFGWLKWFGEKQKVEEFHISDDEISKELYFWQPVKHPATMFRRDRFGEFDAPFDKAGDFWFWAKHKDRHFHLIEKVLVHYRRHAGEFTKNKAEFRENSARIIQKSLKDRFEIEPDLDICRMLDRYSFAYMDPLKQFIRGLL